jgi:NAD(P)-dependent dehydrogenase (short-subunit alcohol dehydrogenase family)
LAEELNRDGQQAIFVDCDVRSKAQIEAMVAATVNAFGGVDILVNNAGVGASTPLLETAEDRWDEVIDTNLKGHFLCAVAVVPRMAARGGGAIVNTSSILAVATLPNCGPYTASKAGIIGLTRAMALEWGPLGIRVNCILPGSTDTSMLWEGVPPDRLPQERERLERAIPLGRIASPEEIAEATVWLCSPRASFVTGSLLWLDGGVLVRSASPR